MKRTSIVGLCICTVWLLAIFHACKKDETAEEDLSEIYPGGQYATTFDLSENAFGVAVKELTAEQEGFFVTGNSFFRSNWVTAPGSVGSLDGLGPVFNAISCGSCHFKDGRARPPLSSSETLTGLLFRLSIPGTDINGEPLPDPNYGGQFQEKSILGVQQEGDIEIAYEEWNGTYKDGTPYTLRKPVYSFSNLQYGELNPSCMVSPRIANQLPGIGLLEAIPENILLEWADPADANGDGISGKANFVWDEVKKKLSLGRFGWKANQPSILQQTAAAFNGDIGITSSIFPKDHLTAVQMAAYPDVPNGGSPELSDDILKKVVAYQQALSVPVRRNHDDADVIRGKAVFSQVKCSSCHRPAMTTGDSDFKALSFQKIYPYTDLLLHDMGSGLADNRPDFDANGQEWKTPPLWGIGLIKVVNGHTFLLHDGRARNIEEAILWHGGEAETSLSLFKELSKKDRNALIRFVESL